MKYFLFSSLIFFSSGLYAADLKSSYDIPDIQAGVYKLNFIPDINECGNAGCRYTIKVNGPDGMKAFDAFLHPKAFKVFFNGDDQKIILALYHRVGTENGKFCGYLIFEALNYASGGMIELSKTKIFPQNEDKQVYEELFGP